MCVEFVCIHKYTNWFDPYETHAYVLIHASIFIQMCINAYSLGECERTAENENKIPFMYKLLHEKSRVKIALKQMDC